MRRYLCKRTPYRFSICKVNSIPIITAVSDEAFAPVEGGPLSATCPDMIHCPKSPKEIAGGMMYFARMLDKIRLHARGELGTDYHQNLGKAHAADGACCAFLGVDYAALTKRVLEGGTDEEILEWCYHNGRQPREVDLMLWNSFASKLGWRDFATATLDRAKKKHGIEHRTDIVTIPDLIDFDEGRIS